MNTKKDCLNLNKDFRIVFSPYQLDLFDQRKRFLIGGGQLAVYISSKNVLSVIERVSKTKVDRTTIKFRKYGKLDFYVK